MSGSQLPPSSKVPPRFLPTLTEVIQPGNRPASIPISEPDEAPLPSHGVDSVDVSNANLASPHSQVEELIERVMERLQGTIESQIREVVSGLIDEQVRLLEPIMVQEVLHAVRQSVTEAVTLDISSQPKSAEFDL